MPLQIWKYIFTILKNQRSRVKFIVIFYFLQQLELAAAASGAGDANSPPSASSPGGGSSCGGVMGVTSLLSSPPDIINNSSVGTAGNAAQQNKKTSSRRNAWGNLSYADLITQAIKNSPDQRLTLSQVYEWMVANIPYFKDKGDSNSSAGWKVSVKNIWIFMLRVNLQFFFVKRQVVKKYWQVASTLYENVYFIYKKGDIYIEKLTFVKRFFVHKSSFTKSTCPNV